ncbi:MAG TPA: chemotaxis protein CheB [Ktedonobacteraceae bacterium]|jgi:two-component system chemotaxis response regulator CheB|nr:chemotaxis protein CheB [Ktedonobacteraceae bacterium]
MPGHDIVVVGASAGGVEALIKLVSGFPADLPASVFIVLHIPAQSPSLLPGILSRSGPLQAAHPSEGEAIQQGRIYIAPPNLHMLLEAGYIHLVRGPKENRHRPAIDPLFRSAAAAYGPQVVGVILTGSLDDGAAGLLAIKRLGGVAIVQDPQEALYPGMPTSALQHVKVDHTLLLSEIGAVLARLAREPVIGEGNHLIPEDMELEVRMAEMDMDALNNGETVGTPSVFSCPECGGVLWEIKDGELTRYRCRVGHAFSTESIIAAQAERLEDALWAALKTLEESANLCRNLAQQARERDQNWLVQRFEARLREAEHRAELIRSVLFQDKLLPTIDLAATQD